MSAINQCDGCRRGLPIINGNHRGPGYDIMGCTKDRYEVPAAPASPAEGPATGGDAREPSSMCFWCHSRPVACPVCSPDPRLAAAERARDEATARAERAEAYIRKLFPQPTGATIRCGPVGEPTTLTPEQVEQITHAVDAHLAATRGAEPPDHTDPATPARSGASGANSASAGHSHMEGA